MSSKKGNEMSNSKEIDAFTKIHFSGEMKAAFALGKKLKSPPDQNSEEEPQTEDCLYCNAEQGSEEWKKYQASRLKSLKNLKKEKESAARAHHDQMDSDETVNSNPRTILKRRGARKSRSISAGGSIRWKEPLSDNEGDHLPDNEKEVVVRKQKGKKAVAPYNSLGKKKSSTKTFKKKSATKSSPANMKTSRESSSTMRYTAFVTQRGVNQSLRMAEARAKQSGGHGPRKSSPSSKKAVQRPLWTWATPRKTLVKPITILPTVSSGQIETLIHLSNKQESSTSIPKSPVKPIRPAQRKPPKFPELGACNVFPGTPEWDEYWTNYKFNLNKYNEAMNDFGKGIDEFSQDIEDYKQKLKRITMEDEAFAIQMGMKPRDNKPPLLRQPLTQSMTMIGGYMIRRMKKDERKSGVALNLTTFDHIGFRLEIMFDQLVTDVESYSFKIDQAHNLLIISLESKSMENKGAVDGGKREKGVASEEIHIGAPVGKRVEDIEIGNPLQNGGKLVITAI